MPVCKTETLTKNNHPSIESFWRVLCNDALCFWNVICFSVWISLYRPPCNPPRGIRVYMEVGVGTGVGRRSCLNRYSRNAKIASIPFLIFSVESYSNTRTLRVKFCLEETNFLNSLMLMNILGWNQQESCHRLSSKVQRGHLFLLYLNAENSPTENVVKTGDSDFYIFWAKPSGRNAFYLMIQYTKRDIKWIYNHS